MDLFAYVPDNQFRLKDSDKIIQETVQVNHICEQINFADPVRDIIKGETFLKTITRWFVRKIIVSRKHLFTIWSLKSTTAINNEIIRHLKSYPYMIHPFSSFRLFWETLMIISGYIFVFITPFLLTFYYYEERKWQIFLVIDLIFLVDIIMWFLTGYYDYHTKVIIFHPKIVALKYLKSYFIIDIIPALPLRALVHFIPVDTWYCLLLSLLKILRMRIIMTYSRRVNRVFKMSFQQYKILEMVMIILMIIHWTACLGYYVPLAVYDIYTHKTDSWIFSDLMQKKTTIAEKYIACLNKAILTLACSTQYFEINSPEDILLNIIFTIVGVIGLIYILVKFFELLSSIDCTKRKNLKMIQQLKQYMKYRDLPNPLKQRSLQYCQYRNKKGFDRDRRIIAQVSPHLREELILHKHRVLLNNVPLFKYLSIDAVSQVCAAFKSEIYLVDEVLITAGHRGHSFYYIVTGTVAVYDAQDREICHLEDGAYFGELALVMENEYRNATVKVTEICQISVLYQDDFLHIISKYKNLHQYMQNMMLIELRKIPTLEEARMRHSTELPTVNVSIIKASMDISRKKEF